MACITFFHTVYCIIVSWNILTLFPDNPVFQTTVIRKYIDTYTSLKPFHIFSKLQLFFSTLLWDIRPIIWILSENTVHGKLFLLFLNATANLLKKSDFGFFRRFIEFKVYFPGLDVGGRVKRKLPKYSENLHFEEVVIDMKTLKVKRLRSTDYLLNT